MRAGVFVVAAAAALCVAAAAALPGGMTPANVADAGVQQALEFAVTEMNSQSNAVHKLVVTRVVDARQQIVKGIKYSLTLEGGLSTECPNDGQLQSAEACPVTEENLRMYVVEVLFTAWEDSQYTLLSVTEVATSNEEPREEETTDDADAAQPCDVLWTGYAPRSDGSGCEWVSEHGCTNPSLFRTEEECLAATTAQAADEPDSEAADGEAADDSERPQLCQMVFSGFEYDAEQGACVEKSFRGCSNPFEHATLEACRDAQAQPGAEPCLVQVSGWEYDDDSGSCVQRTLIDCSNSYPFEFATEKACLESHAPEQPQGPIGGVVELGPTLDNEAWEAITFAVGSIQRAVGDHGLVFIRLVHGRRQVVNGVFYTFTVELAQSSACPSHLLYRLRTSEDCPVDAGAPIIRYSAKVIHRPWTTPNYALLAFARSSVPAAPTCMLVWRGFVLDEATNVCEEKTATGCQNPFKYATLQECSEGGATHNGGHAFHVVHTHMREARDNSALPWILGGVAVGAIVAVAGTIFHVARRRRAADQSFYDLLHDVDEKALLS